MTQSPANEAVPIMRSDYEAMVEALLTAKSVIEQEANSRAGGCDPTSAYEREPIEAIALIDAALAKVTP
jgi:hypothetical protein